MIKPEIMMNTEVLESSGKCCDLPHTFLSLIPWQPIPQETFFDNGQPREHVGRKAAGLHSAPAAYGRRAAGHRRPCDTGHPYSLRTERLILAEGTDHVKRPYGRCASGDSALRFRSCCGDNQRRDT